MFSRSVFILDPLSLVLAACNTQKTGMAHHGDGSQKQFTAAEIAAAVDVHNTRCPVTGDEVANSGVIDIYASKVYHFCCGDCVDDFESDPAEYVKLMNAHPAKYGIK